MELNRNRFEDWLLVQDPNRQINPSHCHYCFWGAFAQEVAGFNPTVFVQSWKPWDGEPMRPLPEWFMRLLGGPWNGYHNLRTCGDMQSRYRELFPDTMPVVPPLDTLDKPLAFHGVQPK